MPPRPSFSVRFQSAYSPPTEPKTLQFRAIMPNNEQRLTGRVRRCKSWCYVLLESAPCRNRTYNLVIKSHLLCQLS